MQLSLPRIQSASLLALIAQLIALAAIFILAAMAKPLLTLFEWALLQGLIAGIISYYFKMATWWLPIQTLFVPVLVLTLTLQLSPLWFGAAFFLLLLTYGKTFQTQVPLYLSSQKAAQAIESLLPTQNHFSFIDLGSGCGGLINDLSKSRGNGRYVGIEAAPLPLLISKIRNLFQMGRCNIKWGDFWQHDLSQYDVVYAYLSPVPMASLWKKARKEMRPGSILISNTFQIPGVTPEKSIPLNDFSGSTLYLWRI